MDISVLESPQARDLITTFNAAIQDIPELAKERAANSDRLENALKNQDTIGSINAEHNGKVIGIKMEDLTTEAHNSREASRKILFAGIENPEGRMRFLPINKLPVGATNDGRTWRIRVGNNRLDPHQLPDVADRSADTARKIASAVRGLDGIVGDVLSFSRELKPTMAVTSARELYLPAVDALQP